MMIRRATLDDSAAISQLITPLVTAHILPSCSSLGAEILLASMSAQKIAEYIKQGYQYHVAIIENQIIALIGIKNLSHLYHLFVSEQYQGQGIAKKLWEQAKSISIEQHQITTFTVNSALNAADLYIKWGFSPLSDIRERSGIKDIPMQLTLPVLDE